MTDRLDVHGVAIEVRWWRPPVDAAGRPLVLLHEGLGSISLWRDFPAALSTRTRRPVFAYSRAGHGGSDLPPAPHTTRFMHEEAIAWLPAILDRAGIDDAVLLGHSDGGSIALIFAATYPSRARALVLEAPHVFVEDISVASIARAKAHYEAGDLRRRLSGHHADVDAAFRGWNDVWLDPAFRAWNLEAYLPAVMSPTLVIQGEQDEYGTIAQVDAIVNQLAAPVERLILPNCGHSPHREQPAKVLDAISRFLTHVPPSRSTAG